MEGWKEVRFGDVVQFPPKIKMKKGENYPFIPMENLDSGIKYVKPIIEKELKGGGAKFEEGDTLFSRITPCLQNGKIAQAKNLENKPGFGSTEYFVFRGIENKTDTDFIYYLSKSQWFKGNAENSMVGSSGRQRADAGFVRNLKIKLPPLPTQRKIASILSSYDDLMENNLKRIKLLEEKAQLTYEEWFVRMKFPRHETTPIDEVTGLPEGWKKMPLGEFTKVLKGKNITKSTIREGNVPVVAGGLSPAYYHDTPNTKNPVITVSASGANAGFTNMYLEDVWASDCSYIDRTMCDNLFFVYALMIQNQPKIYHFQKGAAQPHVYPKDLVRLEAVIPTEDFLSKFNKISMDIFDSIRLLTKQNQFLKEARDILLPRLMTGMIDVEQMNVQTLKPTKA